MDEKIPIFDQVVAFPSWYLINLAYPFLPKWHLEKKLGRVPTLSIWTQYRTPITVLFDTVFWMCGTCVLISLVSLYFKSIVGA